MRTQFTKEINGIRTNFAVITEYTYNDSYMKVLHVTNADTDEVLDSRLAIGLKATKAAIVAEWMERLKWYEAKQEMAEAEAEANGEVEFDVDLDAVDSVMVYNDPDSVPVYEDFEGCVKLLAVYSYNDGDVTDFVKDLDNNADDRIFETYADAREWIGNADSSVYYLSHNEYSRPHYSIVAA